MGRSRDDHGRRAEEPKIVRGLELLVRVRDEDMTHDTTRHDTRDAHKAKSSMAEVNISHQLVTYFHRWKAY